MTRVEKYAEYRKQIAEMPTAEQYVIAKLVETEGKVCELKDKVCKLEEDCESLRDKVEEKDFIIDALKRALSKLGIYRDRGWIRVDHSFLSDGDFAKDDLEVLLDVACPSDSVQ